jgi:hypothetical protein
MPGDRSSLSLDASLAIPRMSSSSKSLSALVSHLCLSSLQSWLCGSTKEPDGFVVNRCKRRELGASSTPIPLMTWPPQLSRLDLGFEAQPRKRTQLHLAFLATMPPTLDLVGYQVP